MGLTRPRYSNIVDTDYKASVRVVTTTNITLSDGAPVTYDGVTLVAGDRVLVAGQNTGSQNGIYSVTTVGSGSNGTWSRSFDTNSSDRLTAGMQTVVSEGTYAGQRWILTTADPIVLGTTSLTFVAGSNTAGGANKQVQYNASGIGSGATNLIYESSTGNVVATASTASTSTTTGALVVTGGTGIGGNLHVGGNIVGGGVRSTSSISPPSTPTVGDIWYNTGTDNIYRYTSDSANSYWLDITGSTLLSNSITSYTFANITVTGAANIGGNLNVTKSGLFQGPYDENSTTSGVFIGNTGTGTPSPRIGFYTGDTSKNWQIDNYGGTFRWFVPGSTKMELTATGDLSVNPGNLSVAGNATVSGNAGIIQPNRTAFRVYGNGGTVGLNGNLTSTVFTVDYQQGYASTALNTSTGKFTAPITGLYNTTLTARTTTNTNSGIIQAAIYIKSGASSAVAAFIEWGTNTSFNHASTGTTVKLNVGDQMWVQCTAVGGGTGFSFDGNDHWDVVYLG